MSTLFPNQIQDMDAGRGTSGQPLSNPNHITHHTTEDDTIEALQVKVGVDNSAVTTTLDYKLKNTASINPGHRHTLDNLSDVNAPSPAPGDFLNWNGSEWAPASTTAPDASTTVKGVSKLSTAPVSPTDPISVGDNDTRVPTQGENDALQGTSGTPSNTNRYVTNDDTTGTGPIVRGDIALQNFYGDASDGTVIFNGVDTVLGLTPAANVYTLTRDIYCNNITLNVGVTIRTAGFRIFVQDIFTNDGIILNNGNNGTVGGNAIANIGGTAGIGGSAPSAITVTSGSSGSNGATGGVNNASGVNGIAGSSVLNSAGTAGGTGGTGGQSTGNGTSPGGIGGILGTLSAANSTFRDAITALTQRNLDGIFNLGTGGTGGGSGSANSFLPNDNAGGGGGGGGSTGGMVFIVAKYLAGTGAITALGGNGGNGGNAFATTGNAGAGGGGGGGGGSGGVIIIITSTSANPYTLTVTGGTGGTGGNGATSGVGFTGNAGSMGANGSSGMTFFVVI